MLTDSHAHHPTRSRNPFRAQLDPDVRDLCGGVRGTILPHGDG
jgi:hypothetical protein